MRGSVSGVGLVPMAGLLSSIIFGLFVSAIQARSLLGRFGQVTMWSWVRSTFFDIYGAWPLISRKEIHNEEA